jgi:hypothetical protein
VQTQTHSKIQPLWLSHTIRTIWHLVSKLWKHQCDINNGTTPDDKRQRALQRLTSKIHSIFEKQDQIDPSDKHIFDKSCDQILQMPTNRIERWIFKAEIRIKESIEQNKQNTQRTTYAIQHFFQRIIPAHIPNIQPHPRPKHQHHQYCAVILYHKQSHHFSNAIKDPLNLTHTYRSLQTTIYLPNYQRHRLYCKFIIIIKFKTDSEI